MVSGDLISFIDSYDYGTTDYLEYLFRLMDMGNSDVSCSDLAENGPHSEDYIKKNVERRVSHYSFMLLFLLNWFHCLIIFADEGVFLIPHPAETHDAEKQIE